MSHAVGVDVGTSNVKVALVADDGRLVSSASGPVAYRRAGHIAEQDAELLWQRVVDAIASTTAAAPAAARDVEAIGVCSQYSSIVPVDGHGRPTGPMILYWDRRGTGPSLAIMERHPEALGVFVQRHGIPPVGAGLSLGHILSMQHDQPDVHGATRAYLEPMDYVNARLTGRLAATQCTMFMVQVCDNRSVGVTEYDPDLVRLAGVDDTRLPPLVPIDGVVGHVGADVADQIGVPAGAAVVAGMNDSQAGAFAAGAFASGRGGVAIGTTAVMLDTVDDQRVDLERELVSMPSPVPGRYLVWAENGIAGKAVEHVLEHVLHASDALGDHRVGDPFGALDAALDASVPGSNGVLFLPWLAGSLAPAADSRMRGALVNLSLETDRVDVVRALVEGTAHNLRWLLPAVESFTGRPLAEVAFFGGAARSRRWAQVLADVLDRPVLALVDPDRAVACAVASVALRRTVGWPDELGGSVAVDACYEPRACRRRTYDPMHEQFVAAFTALRPIHDALVRGRPLAEDT